LIRAIFRAALQQFAHCIATVVTEKTTEVCEYSCGTLVHNCMDEIHASEFNRRATIEAVRQAFHASVFPGDIRSLHAWFADELRLCVNTAHHQQTALLQKLVGASCSGPLALLIHRLHALEWKHVLGIVYDFDAAASLENWMA